MVNSKYFAARFTNSTTCSHWLVSSIDRALHRYQRGQGFESRTSLNFFRLSFRNCKSCVYDCDNLLSYNSLPSLRSRRVKVVGTRKNGRVRGRHTRGNLACLPRARPFSLSLTTSQRLLRRLFSTPQFSYMISYIRNIDLFVSPRNVYQHECGEKRSMTDKERMRKN